MSLIVRNTSARAVTLAVGSGPRLFDLGRDAEWEVPPAQIATAKKAGTPSYQTRPGSVTVLPIRSETADILPFKRAGAGLAAGALLLATRNVARSQ